MSTKRGAQQLIAAINRQDIAALRNLLAQGADPNASVDFAHRRNVSLLMCAAGGQFTEGVDLLLEAGANPNARADAGPGAEGGGTALHNAIIGSDTRRVSPGEKRSERDRFMIVDLLLKAGADPNAVDQGDGLPLAYAASAGQFEICERLIEAGAAFNTCPAGSVPPLVAAAGGVPAHGVEEGRKQERVAKYLLELGAPTDAETSDGLTALMAAATRGSERLVALLLDHGADVNHRSRDGRTPLICAALYAEWAAADAEHHLALRNVTRLVEAGADPHARNSNGERACDIAARGRGQLAAEYLRAFAS